MSWGNHVTGLFLLLCLLLQSCQCQRDKDYLQHTLDVPPVFLNTSTDVRAQEGSMAVLQCSVQFLGPRQVAWRKVGAKDGHFLTVGQMTWTRRQDVLVEYYMERGHITHWNLLIKAVTQADAGMYECQVTAKAKISRFITLHIIGPPVFEPDVSVQGKEYVEKGDKIYLVCNATGGNRIPEDVDWFKDGSKIDSHRVVITKFRSLQQQALVSELTIPRSRMKDTGTYICRSSEKAIDSLKVTVLVTDKTNKKRDNPEGTTDEESGDFRRLAGSSGGRQRAAIVWTLVLYAAHSVLAT